MFFNVGDKVKLSELALAFYPDYKNKVFDKLNKTQRKEQIVVWEKVNGEVVKYGKEFQTNQ